MAAMTQTAFRLDDTDYAILDEVKTVMGLSSRTDALRFILRAFARQNQIAGAKPNQYVSDDWLFRQARESGALTVEARQARGARKAQERRSGETSAKPSKPRKRK